MRRLLPTLAGPVIALVGLTGCDKVADVLRSGEGGGSDSAEVRHLDRAGFQTFVETPEQVAVVDFYADWCGPCKSLAPVLEDVVGGYDGEVALAKVDVDQHKSFAGGLGVRAIPDVRIYRDGVEVDSFTGNIPAEQIRAKLDAQVAKIGESVSGEKAAESDTGIRPMDEEWMPKGIERR